MAAPDEFKAPAPKYNIQEVKDAKAKKQRRKRLYRTGSIQPSNWIMAAPNEFKSLTPKNGILEVEDAKAKNGSEIVEPSSSSFEVLSKESQISVKNSEETPVEQEHLVDKGSLDPFHFNAPLKLKNNYDQRILDPINIRRRSLKSFHPSESPTTDDITYDDPQYMQPEYIEPLTSNERTSLFMPTMAHENTFKDFQTPNKNPEKIKELEEIGVKDDALDDVVIEVETVQPERAEETELEEVEILPNKQSPDEDILMSESTDTIHDIRDIGNDDTKAFDKIHIEGEDEEVAKIGIDEQTVQPEGVEETELEEVDIVPNQQNPEEDILMSESTDIIHDIRDIGDEDTKAFDKIHIDDEDEVAKIGIDEQIVQPEGVEEVELEEVDIVPTEQNPDEDILMSESTDIIHDIRDIGDEDAKAFDKIHIDGEDEEVAKIGTDEQTGSTRQILIQDYGL